MSDEQKTPVITRESTMSEVADALARHSIPLKDREKAVVTHTVHGIKSGDPNLSVGEFLDDSVARQHFFVNAGIGEVGRHHLLSFMAEKGMQVKKPSDKTLKPSSGPTEIIHEMTAAWIDAKGHEKAAYGKVIGLLKLNGLPEGFNSAEDLVNRRPEAEAGFKKGKDHDGLPVRFGNADVKTLYAFLDRKMERQQQI